MSFACHDGFPHLVSRVSVLMWFVSFIVQVYFVMWFEIPLRSLRVPLRSLRVMRLAWRGGWCLGRRAAGRVPQ